MGSCSGCGAKFSIFKRKITCRPCQRYFCAGCTTRSQFNTEVCKSCKVLLSCPLDRADVKSLKVKDLQHFLKIRRIPYENIIEKEDLINLVIVNIQGTTERIQAFPRTQQPPPPGFVGGFSNPNYSPSSDLPYSEDTGGNRQQDDIPPQDAPPSQSPPSPPFAEEVVSIPSTDTELSDAESVEYPCPELNRRGNVPADSGNSIQSETNSSGNIEENNTGFKRKSCESLLEGPVSLNQIDTVDQLELLSVRQLRDILWTNRVEYKGCVEKSELLDKVRRLWKEYRSMRDVDNLPEDEICKICMNAPVNCVILECGHMLSCVDCGRQLAECPLCRQYVVRVVRTFKA